MTRTAGWFDHAFKGNNFNRGGAIQYTATSIALDDFTGDGETDLLISGTMNHASSSTAVFNMFQLFVNNNTGGANPKWQEVTGSQEDPLRNLLALLDAMTHPGYHHPGDTGSVGTLLGNRDTLVRDPNTGDLLLWRGSIVIIVHNEGSVKKPIYGTKNTTFERELYESGINLAPNTCDVQNLTWNQFHHAGPETHRGSHVPCYPTVERVWATPTTEPHHVAWRPPRRFGGTVTGAMQILVGMDDGTIVTLERSAGTILSSGYKGHQSAQSNGEAFQMWGHWRTLVTESEGNEFHAIDVGTGARPQFVDVNSDGVMDLIVGNNAGELRFFEDTSSSSLKSLWVERTLLNNPFFGLDDGAAQISSAQFVDVSGDGVLDIIALNVDGKMSPSNAITIVEAVEEGTGDWVKKVFGANPFSSLKLAERNIPDAFPTDATQQAFTVGGGGTIPTLVTVSGSTEVMLTIDVLMGKEGQEQEKLVFRHEPSDCNTWHELVGDDNPFPSGRMLPSAQPAYIDRNGDGEIDYIVAAGAYQQYSGDGSGGIVHPNWRNFAFVHEKLASAGWTHCVADASSAYIVQFTGLCEEPITTAYECAFAANALGLFFDNPKNRSSTTVYPLGCSFTRGALDGYTDQSKPDLNFNVYGNLAPANVLNKWSSCGEKHHVCVCRAPANEPQCVNPLLTTYISQGGATFHDGKLIMGSVPGPLRMWRGFGPAETVEELHDYFVKTTSGTCGANERIVAFNECGWARMILFPRQGFRTHENPMVGRPEGCYENSGYVRFNPSGGTTYASSCSSTFPCICRTDTTTQGLGWNNPLRNTYTFPNPCAGCATIIDMVTTPTFVDIDDDGFDDLVVASVSAPLKSFVDKNAACESCSENWKAFFHTLDGSRGLSGVPSIKGTVTSGVLCGAPALLATEQPDRDLLFIGQNVRCDLDGQKQRSCYDVFAGFCPDPLRTAEPVCECFRGYNSTHCSTCSQGYGRASDGFCEPCAVGTFGDRAVSEKCIACGSEEVAHALSDGCASCSGESVPDASRGSCNPCARGTFKTVVQINISIIGTCATCPDSIRVTCAAGRVTLKPDSWFSSASPFSEDTMIYECHQPGACLPPEAGDAAIEVKCREGHDIVSVLCASCIKDYALDGSACKKCGTSTTMSLATAGLVIVLSSFVIVSVAKKLITADSRMRGRTKSVVGVLLRVTINFAQTAKSANLVSMSPPDGVASTISEVNSVMGGLLIPFPVQCLLSWSYWDRAWFYLALPGFALIFSILIAPLAMIGLRLKAALCSYLRKEGKCTCIVGTDEHTNGATRGGLSAGLVPKFNVPEDVLLASFDAADVSSRGRLTAMELRSPAVKLIPPGVTQFHLERLMARYTDEDDPIATGMSVPTIDFEGFKKLNRYLAVQKIGLLIGTVAVICFFFVYMQTTGAALDLFAMQEVEGVRYMQSALSERALVARHITLLFAAVAAIVLVVAGGPGSVFATLCVLRRCCGRPENEKWNDIGIGERENCLDDARVRVIFGFLYDGFKSDRWWWEGLVVIRKLLLVVNASVLSAIAPYFQSLVASTILVGAIALHCAFKPFKSDLFNGLELAAVCLLFNLLFSLCRFVRTNLYSLRLTNLNPLFFLSIFLSFFPLSSFST